MLLNITSVVILLKIHSKEGIKFTLAKGKYDEAIKEIERIMIFNGK